jgi:SpoIID/LytB domain protein
LQILPSDAGLRVINHLPLEQYLASVVGSEMPASWPQAALRAQAVAARTYVLRQRKPRALFDVTATTASQVYRGLEAETASTREAVAATRGQVLLFDGGLLDAVFHSSSGGASTENSGEIWNQQLPYLVSVPDLDDLSPVQNWQQTLAPELLRKAFGEIGGALRIEVLTTSTSGRIRQARVTGPAGTLLLSGTQLRSRLGLRSTLVRFESLPLDPATNRPLDPAAQPTWTMLPSSLKLIPNITITGNTLPGNTLPGNTMLGNAMLGNALPGNAKPGNTAINNSALSKAMPGNMITGINSSASVPLAGGSTTNVSGAINYRSIASGSATSGSLASGATGTASKTALAISALTASSAAAVAPAGNASQGGISVGGYIPGMPTSTSLASLLPPPPLLPAIVPEPLQFTPPTLLAIGRGFGHGVGMSQWGAYGLARRGEDYQRILLHYYRGSELRPYAAALVSP